MKKQTKKPLTVHLGPAQRRALALISKQHDVSMGRLIREGVEHVIRDYTSKGGKR